MDARDRDLAARVHVLERMLDDTRGELARLQRRQRAFPALAMAVAGSVALALGGRGLDAQGTGQKVTTPFTVVDPAGKTVLEVLSNEGRPTLHIGDTNGGVWIGKGKSGIGFMIIQRSNGTNAISLGHPEGGTLGVQVLEESGKTALGEIGLAAGGKSGAVTIRAASGQKVLDSRIDAGNHPILNVGEKGGVWLGSGASGSGFVVTKHPNDTDALALGQMEGGAPGVRVLDSAGKRVLAELAATDGDAGGSLTVAGASGSKAAFKIAPVVNDGDAVVAVTGGTKGGDLRIADASGKAIFRVSPDASAKDARVSIGAAASGAYGVHVANASGTDVGGFGEAKVGGGVVYVTDGSGVTRMLMSGTGQLHAADGSGATRATMTSDGAFSIRSSSGTTIARLGEGNGGGVFQLANMGGNAMVDAGVLPSGIGAVRTYPLGIPPGAALGMPGTFIMGMRGK